MTEYVVRFSEISEEAETFEFKLGDSFFKVFQSSEWQGGTIDVFLLAKKRADGITFDIKLKGELEVFCDRCLDSYKQIIEFGDRLFVKFGQEEGELDYNVVVINKDDNQIDLSQFIYEYLVLSLPVRRVHPEKSDGSSGCNSEMIKRLEKHLVTEETIDLDPRWDDLKKLLDKN